MQSQPLVGHAAILRSAGRRYRLGHREGFCRTDRNKKPSLKLCRPESNRTALWNENHRSVWCYYRNCTRRPGKGNMSAYVYNLDGYTHSSHVEETPVNITQEFGNRCSQLQTAPRCWATARKARSRLFGATWSQRWTPQAVVASVLRHDWGLLPLNFGNFLGGKSKLSQGHGEAVSASAQHVSRRALITRSSAVDSCSSICS